jgi:hypothetical protein
MNVEPRILANGHLCCEEQYRRVGNNQRVEGRYLCAKCKAHYGIKAGTRMAIEWVPVKPKPVLKTQEEWLAHFGIPYTALPPPDGYKMALEARSKAHTPTVPKRAKRTQPTPKPTLAALAPSASGTAGVFDPNDPLWSYRAGLAKLANESKKEEN